MLQLECALIEKCWLCATAYLFELLLTPNAGWTWVLNMAGVLVSFGDLNLENQLVKRK